MESVDVVMTPCMPSGGKYWGVEGPVHDKCPGSLGKFKCRCSHHKTKKSSKKIVRRKRA